MNPNHLSFLILVLLAATTFAQDEPPENDFTVPPGMVRREFPLGTADVLNVETLAKETVGEGGKYFIFKTRRVLLVIDKPQNVETIRQMLPHISTPARNVKIEFISRTHTADPFAGGEVRGVARGGNGRVFGNGQSTGTPGVFTRQSGGGDRGDISRPIQPGGVSVFDNRRGGAIDIDVLNQQGGGSSLNSQFVVVRSGNEGTIEVTREIPMVDYFTRFIADGNFGAVLGINPRVLGANALFPLAGGRFEVPEIRWEKAGSRLLVRPSVDGDLIHLEIMPQISAVVIVDPEALRRRELNTYLTGREQYVTFTKLSTSVTVANGAEVRIGGFGKATPEFNSYFWGGQRGGTTSAGSMTVRATIQ